MAGLNAACQANGLEYGRKGQADRYAKARKVGWSAA
jgi:hypothetical protein